MRRLAGALCASLALAAAFPPAALAHAELRSARPEPGASLPASPGRIRVTLTEEVGPLSRLSLVGPGGRRVSVRSVRVERETIEAAVGPLPEGTYTVRWAAVSPVDGHVSSGVYRFRVGAGRLSEARPAGAFRSVFFFRWSPGRLAGGRLLALTAAAAAAVLPATRRRVERIWLPAPAAYLGLLAFSGHASLDSSGSVVPPILDAVHLTAASAWLGGIVILGFVARPTEADAGAARFAEAVRRFSPFAVAAAAALVATGIFATDQQVGSFSALAQ